ncbi:GAK system XXXCH domain-containing protein [Desulfatirhabdium butyrativorans]|uniref:GAK system XXXCH domain-containing protein n=1 Tax=Desulfatirhabdium butyrativorans TaxID=340467 RepID=UPI00040595AB|nr:GAK system XXXCH domain-containing protein [Desulfatirhabdium butyrativorans]
MKRKNTQEFIVFGADAISFLQRILEDLSGKVISSERQPLDFDRIKKLKLRIRKTMNQPLIECKIKYRRDSVEATETQTEGSPLAEKPEYPVLKKRLKKLFQSIEGLLEEGRLPSNVEMDLFCKHAAEMTTYPGYGDERYPEFLDLIRALQQAYLKTNVEGFREVWVNISAMKKACHHK